MKSFISVFIGLIMMQAASVAKTTVIGLPSLYPYFNPGSSSSQASGNSRIISQAFLKFNGTVFESYDSTTYKYAFGRGGQLNEELLDDFVNFEESFTYVYDAVNQVYNNRLWRFQTYNSLGKAEYYTYRKWVVPFDDPAYWKDSARFVYTYNNGYSRIENSMYQNWYGFWSDHYEYVNSYDANNNLIKVEGITYKLTLNYDALNRLVMQESQYISGGVWVFEPRYTLVYNTNNQIESYTKEEWSGGWANTVKVEFTYNAGMVETQTEYTWNNGWEPSGKHIFDYNSDHKKIKDIHQVWDQATLSYVNEYRVQYTYNTSKQPLTVITDTWDIPASSWVFSTDDVLYRFYYESFDPTSSFDPEKAKQAFNVFPIPANNVLNLSLTGKDKSADFGIYDMQGRVLSKGEINNAPAKAISLAELPAGQYFIKVSTASGTASKPFTVIH